MYNSLRDVASQELYDSYRGILRISPNIIDNIEEDNTEYFFNPSNNVNIILSDSDGNILEALQFKAKNFSTSMVGYSSNIDLSVIVHNYTALNVSKKLSLTSILSVNDSLKIINPLSNRTNILIYPSDSPYDAAYCNLNDKLGINNNYDDDVIETGFSNKNLITLLGSNSYTQVEIDGQKIFRESTAGTLIPEVYRHDYILGQAKGGTYKKNNTYITQLSFVSLDKMVWEKLTANLKGLYRHLDGRYKNLGHEGNEEIMTTLFGDTNIDLSNNPLFNSVFYKNEIIDMLMLCCISINKQEKTKNRYYIFSQEGKYILYRDMQKAEENLYAQYYPTNDRKTGSVSFSFRQWEKLNKHIQKELNKGNIVSLGKSDESRGKLIVKSFSK